MNDKKLIEPNEKLLNKIIAVAYNDAGIFDRYIVYRAAKRDKNIQNILKEFRVTAKEVHQITEEECPKEIIELIEQKSISLQTKSNSFTTDFITIVLNRPLISAAASVIVLGAVLIGLFSTRPIQPSYSKNEVETADRQARQAFAIVGKIFNQTEMTLKKEVLNDRVSKPINEGLEIVNNLFN